jgi:CheY-like chemotaxis protein/methyl-accepting chemotaxis protein
MVAFESPRSALAAATCTAGSTTGSRKRQPSAALSIARPYANPVCIGAAMETSERVRRRATRKPTRAKASPNARTPPVSSSTNGAAESLDIRRLLSVLQAVRDGDFSVRLPGDSVGLAGKVADAFNDIVASNQHLACEIERAGHRVGKEGETRHRVALERRSGAWGAMESSVNMLIDDLLRPTTEVTRTVAAVAKGDLSQTVRLEVDGRPLKGEFLRSANIVNTMIEQMSVFTSEVTRVAREVGTEGKLGGQAMVPGAAGTWKDLTDNVNSMANNLTNQVRGIVKVVTAVASGDLRQRLTVESKGEVAALAETINGMTTTLGTFADQVTSVAREVGVEGRLGGQANVPGAAGTWRDLTANVNLLAANLTTQVRAIAEVATAVTKGDLTRSIQVDARGEVSELKDNINAMIGNLRATTARNTEQDWLKTNLAKFGRMMQGQRDLVTVGQMLLAELSPLVSGQRAVMYVMEIDGYEPVLKQLAAYADSQPGNEPRRFALREGLVGQCAADGRRILLENVPEDLIHVTSGLLATKVRHIIALPVLYEGQVKAVIELSTVYGFSESHLAFLEQLSSGIGVVLNTIEATMRTEGLLKQSQELAGELQAQQKELQQTNEELANKAQLLAEQNAEVERKNEEIELAQRALEEKATELALTSRCKSEFLANMSHELRTPLNSILILGQQLAENADANLSERQVEFAKTIHAAGTDLLNLISDILDLSKIESGTVTVESEEFLFTHLRETIERNFRHEAETRSLSFTTEFDVHLGRHISTDPKRLLQVLKNLLSNAFKFTAQGSVRLQVSLAKRGWSPDHPVLNQAQTVLQFAVTDTGIGIAPEKQKIIFEAFQQADAGTSRKYGGTGLGLAISRELAHLLGGELRLASTPSQGSTFTLYLPLDFMGSAYRNMPSSVPSKPSALTYQPVALPMARSEELLDDRERLQPDDRVLLIVEDDPHYGKVLLNLARDCDFKAILAKTGAEGLMLARKHRPTAITLDVFLPDMLGWTVLNQLKQDSATRHIPVQILAVEEERQYSLERGAFSFMNKPATTDGLARALERIKQFASPRIRELLVVEDDPAEQMSIAELIGFDDVSITAAGSGAEALTAMRTKPFDCVVLDLRLPDVSGFELLTEIQKDPALCNTPVVVFTGRELSEEEEHELRQRAQSIVLKGVRSPERLLDETALFLHRVITDLPLSKQRMIETLHQSDAALRDRKVLVVDDDVRNIFALNSVLERRGMEVISASNGMDAISIVESTQDLALVLMDVMMTEMDGYETMRRIRSNPKFRLLPIIALTAKAMKGDREKCLQAGASDYVAKPVDMGQLLSLVRMWLHP